MLLMSNKNAMCDALHFDVVSPEFQQETLFDFLSHKVSINNPSLTI